MICDHCKSSGRACAYCNPDPEDPMSDETTEAPPPRRRHKPSAEELASAERTLNPIPTTPHENIPTRRVIGRYQETLRCKLTRLEVEEKRVEAMQALDEIERIEEELASTTKAIKSRIAKAQAVLNDARRVANSQVEDREVEVVAELIDSVVVYVRQDTYEETRRRPASPSELQEKLFG